MNTVILQQLPMLGFTLLIAVLVWRYYRRRTFARTERYSTFGPRFWTGCVDSCVLWPLSYSDAVEAVSTMAMGLFYTGLALVVVVAAAWLFLPQEQETDGKEKPEKK